MIMKMRDMMKRKNGQKGFTLVELIVVMAILAILAAIAVPRYNQVTENAKNQAVQTNVRTIVSAIQLYQAANKGALPTSEQVGSYLQTPLASMNGQPDGASYSYSSTTSKVTVTGVISGKYSYEASVDAEAI